MAYIICIPNLKRRALFNLPFVAAVHIQPFTNVKGVVNLSKSTSIWCGKYEKKKKKKWKMNTKYWCTPISLVLSCLGHLLCRNYKNIGNYFIEILLASAVWYSLISTVLSNLPIWWYNYNKSKIQNSKYFVKSILVPCCCGNIFSVKLTCLF